MPDIRYIIIFITIFGMETSWLFALLNASNLSVDGRLSIPLLMTVFVISFAVSRALRLLKWPKFFLTALTWVVWAIVMLLMIKVQLFWDAGLLDTVWLTAIPHAFSVIFSSFEPALLILLASGVLWWLGWRLAYLRLDFAAALRDFQFGLIILVIFFFTAYQLELDQSASIPVALSFFSLALIGISVSHARESNSWLNSWRQGHWSGMLLISVALILILGLVISIIVTPDFLQLVLNFFAWVWGLIERLLSWFASLFPQESPEPLPEMPPIPGGEGSEQSGGFTVPEWLRPGMQLGWSILCGGLVLFALWRIAGQIFQWMHRRAAGTGGKVESLKGAFWHDLLDWLKRILSRFLGIRWGIKTRKAARDIPPGIASVRQLYSQLLHWGKNAGYPRETAQTPEEYRYILNGVIPGNREDLDYITREYMNVRYGSSLPSADELDRLKRKWNDLKKAELKKHKKNNTGGKKHGNNYREI